MFSEVFSRTNPEARDTLWVAMRAVIADVLDVRHGQVFQLSLANQGVVVSSPSDSSLLNLRRLATGSDVFVTASLFLETSAYEAENDNVVDYVEDLLDTSINSGDFMSLFRQYNLALNGDPYSIPTFAGISGVTLESSDGTVASEPAKDDMTLIYVGVSVGLVVFLVANYWVGKKYNRWLINGYRKPESSFKYGHVKTAGNSITTEARKLGNDEEIGKLDNGPSSPKGRHTHRLSVTTGAADDEIITPPSTGKRASVSAAANFHDKDNKDKTPQKVGAVLVKGGKDPKLMTADKRKRANLPIFTAENSATHKRRNRYADDDDEDIEAMMQSKFGDNKAKSLGKKEESKDDDSDEEAMAAKFGGVGTAKPLSKKPHLTVDTSHDDDEAHSTHAKTPKGTAIKKKLSTPHGDKKASDQEHDAHLAEAMIRSQLANVRAEAKYFSGLDAKSEVDMYLAATQVQLCLGDLYDDVAFQTIAGSHPGVSTAQLRSMLPKEFSSGNVDAIVAHCKQLGDSHTFVDPDFPPIISSLYSTEKTPGKELVWRRPTSFFKGKPYHVFNDIEPCDILQGSLGDCWFLCALGSMAEFPELIEELFVDSSKQVNEYGVYQLKFCVDGQWKTVTVDDYFPCKSATGSLSYAGCNGNELWAMLAEKAFAKIHGSYSKIVAGQAEEALMEMTGDPCDIYKFRSDHVRTMIEDGTLWDKLVYADSVGYVMAASTPAALKDKNCGLVAGHSYSLIACKLLSNDVKVVLLRNPWGAKEWTGAWGDSSPEWTAKYRAEVVDTKHKFDNATDDGMFWITFDDMLLHCDKVVVSCCRTPGQHPKPWKETRAKTFFAYATESNDVFLSSILKIKPTADTMAVFAVHQTNTRALGAKPYIDIGMSLLKVKSGEGLQAEYEYVSAVGCQIEREVQMEVPMLEAGCEYLIVPLTTGGKLHEQDLLKLESTVNQALFHGEELSLMGCRVVDEIFDRFDMKMQQMLGAPALHWILQIIKPTMPRHIVSIPLLCVSLVITLTLPFMCVFLCCSEIARFRIFSTHSTAKNQIC